MNAYELADYMENKEFRIPNHNEIKAATMLRQQADRIAELEKSLTQYRIENFIEGEYGQTITLAELRKTELYHNVRKQLTKPTHPAKQLSDEEIEKLQQQFTEKGHFADTLNVKEFARAIIKEITG